MREPMRDSFMGLKLPLERHQPMEGNLSVLFQEPSRKTEKPEIRT